MADYAALRALFIEAGYDFVEPAIIHDAGVFVDLAGEDLRRRLYLTSDAEDAKLALRPDFTIPVCLRHLAIGAASDRADYAYLGPVFRQRGAVPGEFLQAGVESLGRGDRIAADAATLKLALDAGRAVDAGPLSVRIGDSALFDALTAALDIIPPWRRRLKRVFGDPLLLASAIAVARKGTPFRGKTVPKDLHGAGRAKIRRVAEARLHEAGLDIIGGRQADEIARRFVEKDALREGIGDRAADVLTSYLAIAAAPRAALAEVRSLAGRRRLSLGTAADRFEKRLDAMESRGIDIDKTVFAADFGRRLDYYTGFVFEAYRKGDSRPVIGGGRYDRLMSMLGAERAIPAVGFAIWLERTGATP